MIQFKDSKHPQVGLNPISNPTQFVKIDQNEFDQCKFVFWVSWFWLKSDSQHPHISLTWDSNQTQMQTHYQQIAISNPYSPPLILSQINLTWDSNQTQKATHTVIPLKLRLQTRIHLNTL